jgi:hypothetical protein
MRIPPELTTSYRNRNYADPGRQVDHQMAV